MFTEVKENMIKEVKKSLIASNREYLLVEILKRNQVKILE